MEMAAGGTGDEPVRARPLNSVLFLLVVVLASICLVGAVLTWQAWQERADARAVQERYGEVLEAADAQATAFLNIDYRKAEESFDAVAEGSTGAFREQYDTSQQSVTQVIVDNESVMTGEVIWSGVSTLDPDSATVLLATSGTVSNTQTDGAEQARNFRLQMELEKVDGRWLTSDLVFVG